MLGQSQRFTTLISLMLSSQTKDEVTSAAIQNLRALFGGHLTLEAILEAKEEDIGQAICKVGFWRRKTGCVPGPLSLYIVLFNLSPP